MYKRFEKFVSRARDAGNDDLLQEDIYVPEMTRNGMKVEEVRPVCTIFSDFFFLFLFFLLKGRRSGESEGRRRGNLHLFHLSWQSDEVYERGESPH
jgi:hypothetical protein